MAMKLIEWRGAIFNAKEIQALKYQRHYHDVFDVAYGGGQMCAYVYLRDKQNPLMFECSKAEFDILKANWLAAME